MSYTVYIAVNVINGKRYVGVTGKGIKHRSRSHWAKARAGGNECPRFYAALRKYGPEAFVWKALFEGKDRGEAYRQEATFVERLQPEYNSAAGGVGAPGIDAWNRREVLCLETGEIHRSAMDAAAFNGVDLSSLCKVLRGEYRWANELHFCYADAAPLDMAAAIAEIDRKFVQARRRVEVRSRRYGGVNEGRDKAGRRATGPMRLAKSVLCVDDGQVFPSLSAAARHYDIDAGALSQQCGGKKYRKTVGGRTFKYLDKAEMH